MNAPATALERVDNLTVVDFPTVVRSKPSRVVSLGRIDRSEKAFAKLRQAPITVSTMGAELIRWSRFDGTRSNLRLELIAPAAFGLTNSSTVQELYIVAEWHGFTPCPSEAAVARFV